MKIENNTNMQPTSQDCSINLQQDKFFNKLTDELKALQTQLFEVEKKVNARDTVIDTLDLSTQTLSVGESTETKDLFVNNNASIQGELSANKATIDTLSVLNDFITQLLHVTDLFANTADIEEADIRSAIIDVLKIKQAILRYDTNQEIVSFPSENVTQIGDIANSILLAGLERPTWNGDPIALTSDLSMGLTPNYKGTLNTETELPPTATVGDFYLIKELTRSGQTGLGGAIYGINKTWEVTLYYELLNYFNKDEINQLFDEELTDDIQRETDIIKGNTPVQVVANGCVMKRDDGTSDRLATAVDAFMLSGPEGMDNIARNSSLDDLVICGQYSADDDLANTITEKPNGEVGAFDIAVGQFSGSKQDIYQLYTGKTSQKNYFRIGLNKEFNNWLELAYTSSIIDKAKEADIAITHKAILISGKGLNINDLNNSANVYGNIYTGLGSDWADGDNLPPEANGSHGFCLEVLPNKSNTVQRYTFNRTKELYVFMRVYDGGEWTEWKQIPVMNKDDVFGVPAGSIISVMGSKHTVKGYLCCDGSTYNKANYSRLALALGADYSISDTQFKVPDLQGRFLQGASGADWGKTVEAGLPNIKGAFSAVEPNVVNLGLFNGAYGCFRTNGASTSAIKHYTSSFKTSSSVSIDASLSGEKGAKEVFGNSTTVQPNAIKTYFYIKY